MNKIARVMLCLGLITTVTAPLSAQIAIGARYGGGEGTANYNLGALTARVGVWDRVHVAGEAQIMGASWACTENPVDAYICGYDGYAVSVGPAISLVDGSRFYLAGRGMGGLFVRTGSEFSGTRELSAGVGLDAEYGLWGPIRVQGGISHQWILDSTYEDLAGETPHVTSIGVGISVLIAEHNDDG